ARGASAASGRRDAPWLRDAPGVKLQPMMIARAAAILMLALQLQPAVLPLLCGSPAGQASGCDQPMSPRHEGLALTGPEGYGPCMNLAMCGISPTATLSSVPSLLSVTESREETQLPRPTVHAIDAPAPLPPPPEA